MSKTLSSGPLRAVQWSEYTMTAVDRPYRLVTMGDSRARANSAGGAPLGFTGSGSAF